MQPHEDKEDKLPESHLARSVCDPASRHTERHRETDRHRKTQKDRHTQVAAQSLAEATFMPTPHKKTECTGVRAHSKRLPSVEPNPNSLNNGFTGQCSHSAEPLPI
jgi:hypothetical protein